MTFAVVRVRGTLRVKPKIKETLKYLRLNKVNHCIVIPETPEYKGMLLRAKDYITWGEIEADTMAMLLKDRSEVEESQRMTDKYVKKNTDFKDLNELSIAISEGTFSLKKIEGLNPVFRLNPPRKGGYEGIKRAFTIGGALGYRSKAINKLLQRMI